MTTFDPSKASPDNGFVGVGCRKRVLDESGKSLGVFWSEYQFSIVKSFHVFQDVIKENVVGSMM